LMEHSYKDTLVVFYYAGHASINLNRHDSIIWSG
jgi:hypothetical protein